MMRGDTCCSGLGHDAQQIEHHACSANSVRSRCRNQAWAPGGSPKLKRPVREVSVGLVAFVGGRRARVCSSCGQGDSLFKASRNNQPGRPRQLRECETAISG